MTNTSPEHWTSCTKPETGDLVRWCEPVWAAPSKPRGKPDQIGEQIIQAVVRNAGEFYQMEVISVEAVTPGLPLKVKEGEVIKRKASSIAKSACHKKLGV